MNSLATTDPLEMYAAWESSGVSPFFPTIDSNSANNVSVRGIGDVLMFGSCDYLGLSQSTALKAAAIDAISRYGTNTHGAQLLCGHTQIHHDLQEHLRRVGPFEAALIFPSGMAANQAVVSSLAGPNDVVISDRTAHISLYMGSWLSKAELRTFPHNNTTKLEAILRRTQDKNRRVILVDGLYSADGDMAPIREIVRLAREYDAITVVDEAHAFGALGEVGLGAAELQGVVSEVDVLVGTMSKAIGSVGGFVLTSTEHQRQMRYLSPSFTSSRSVAPPVAAASLAAFRVLESEGNRLRTRLRENAKLVTEGLSDAGLDLMRTVSHIVPVRIGDEQRTVEASRWLMENGVFVGTFVYPHVPLGEGRLRIGVTSAHTNAEMERLIDMIARANRKFDLSREPVKAFAP